jgi:nucleoid DNA-binding protein
MVKSEIISILSEKIRQKIKKSELETIINLILKTIIE